MSFRQYPSAIDALQRVLGSQNEFLRIERKPLPLPISRFTGALQSQISSLYFPLLPYIISKVNQQKNKEEQSSGTTETGVS